MVGREGRARTRARPVSKDRVAGTRVAFSKTGGVWIFSTVTGSCLLGLTSVGIFPKSNEEVAYKRGEPRADDKRWGSEELTLGGI